MDVILMLSTFLYGILIFSLLFLLKLKFFKSRKEKMLLKLKGPDYNLIFGNSLQFIVPRDDLYNKLITWCSKYSNESVSRWWLGHKAFIIIARARAAEVVLTSNTLLDKGETYKFLEPWFGMGLSTSTGRKWHSRRKLLTPAFHFKILDNFLAVFNEHANVFATMLKMKHDGNGPFDIFPHLAQCTFNIMCETAMGKILEGESDFKLQYFKAVTKIGQSIYMRTMYPWLRPDWLFKLTSFGKLQAESLKLLHSFANQVIAERREEFLKNRISQKNTNEREEIFGHKRRLAFLDLLISCSCDGEMLTNDDGEILTNGDGEMLTNDGGERLTNDDIRDEFNTFIAGGYDTTTIGICWILYNIGRFPEIQQKLHEETDRVIGNDSKKHITKQQLSKLKYMDCVIKESLRLFPPIPLILREITEDTEICGHLIPKDVTACLLLPEIHRDPEFYPNPEMFDPDRFLLENCVKRHPCAYIPFSAGPRNCLGQRYALMELKVMTAYILNQFQVTSVDKLENIKIRAEVVMCPAQGMWLKLESRNKACFDNRSPA